MPEAVNDNGKLEKLVNALIARSTGVWFESRHCKIWGKDRTQGMIRPKCNHLQRKATAVIDKMRELELPVRIIGLKPRQRGSTTFYSAELYCSLRRDSVSGCVIAGQYSQTSEVQEMLKNYSKGDTFDWKNTGEVNSKEGRWSNGSRLKFETAGDKLAGLASTLQVLLCTEVARWANYGVANSNEVLNNLLKCVPLLPDTTILVESTAEGASGTFYERWQTAIDADKFLSGEEVVTPGSYVKIFSAWFEFDDSAIRLTEEQQKEIERTIDSDDEYAGEQEMLDTHGHIDDDGVMRLGTTVTDYSAWEALAWRRYAIREECQRTVEIFNRDYPHSPEAAFMKSGAMRFNSTGLSVQRKRLLKRPAPQYGIVESINLSRFAFRQTTKPEAKVVIFEKPIPNMRYLLSCDPATGASQTTGMDPDNHGVFVLRKGYWGADGKWVRKATAARIVQNMWDPDVLEKELWALSRMYSGRNTSGTKTVIETNLDRGLIELLKLRGADLYQREVFNKREFKTTTAIGYQTNVKTREILIDTLAADIREWDTPGQGIDIWCPDALTQCENFVVKKNGRSEAAENHHDDDVLAIALGSELIEHATLYLPETPSNWFTPPDLRGQGQQAGAGSAYS